MKNPRNKNESGIVSIVVVVMLMVVISLIIISFARVTRREQRQALDRQLSSQAFYAAESGANDAVKIVKAGGVANDYTTDCNQFMAINSLSGNVGTSSNSSYSCLFVDPTPTSFKFSNIDTSSSKIFPITPKDPASVVDTINISWQDKNGGTDLSGCDTTATPAPVLPDVNWYNNCNTGVMRVDLVPVEALDRSSLLDNSMTVFLYPGTSGVTTVSYSTLKGFGGQGGIVRINCDGSGPQQCSVAINGLIATATKYMVRIKSIYRASSATISALAGGTPLELKDGQALVDVTGKASDVLRRMQVRVPLTNYGNAPEFAVQTVDTICKRFTIAPPASFIADGADPSCDLLAP